MATISQHGVGPSNSISHSRTNDSKFALVKAPVKILANGKSEKFRPVKKNVLLLDHSRQVRYNTSGSSCSSPYGRVSASLGFTSDPRVAIERAANGLMKDAASLFLYQDVFRTPPAQAFLKVLLGLRRGDDPAKVLEAYGEFFKLMAIGRFPSWEDYVLEGILCGETNPFAEAAANVGSPKGGVWASGVPQSLRAAAAADLDCLQRLSITESTLSGWVADVVNDVRPEWRAAAALNFSHKAGPAYGGSSKQDNVSNSMGFITTEIAEKQDSKSKKNDLADDLSISNLSGSTEGMYGVGVSPTGSGGSITGTSFGAVLHEERELWRKKIGGLWKWSEAVSMLEEYYTSHSAGRVASSQFLQWRGGKITLDPKWVTTRIGSAADLSIHRLSRENLLQNLTRHSQGHRARHCLLFGPSGSGKSWLLKSVLHEVASSCDLRILTLPAADLRSVSLVLDELGRHWQVRFVLVVDDVMSRVGGEDSYSLLKSALDGNGLDWPENVMLCTTASWRHSSGSGRSDPTMQVSPAGVGHGDLSHLFGAVLSCEALGKDEYVSCVQELVESMESEISLSLSSSLAPEELASRAESWAVGRGVWSVRSAAQFVKSLW